MCIRDRRGTVSTTTNVMAYNIATSEIFYTTAKTFVIDHPQNPDKYLVHACLEGPEAGVYYRGKGVISDGSKETTISLPPYVSAFAKDLIVQVTPIYNGVVRTLNVSEVEHNKFTVFGAPGPFNWVAYGKRGDIVVEPDRSTANVSGDGPYKWIR